MTRNKFIVLTVVKQNHGQDPEPACFYRGDGGVLIPCVRIARSDTGNRRGKIRG
ncbi:MAG: hypothetical protein LBQ79_11250 [Deltaproteobacteria bacterium]|jgi:hypothetical protein|nr:hypothetical protein [Deltaproteobacteria bacterium]